ncbi:MAG TPA: hypothetical protein VLZ89_13260 [Anaerolineales bacterium]|nr:hypothetical protein [Anaerolineales bacterium]
MTTPTNEPTPQETAQNLADAMMQTANSAVAPTLSHLSQLQEQRAARLAAAADRLKSSLGADNARVIALTQFAQAVGLLGQTLNVEATRAARQPAVGPNEWLVYGRVLDVQAQPVAGVQVRVFDRDRKYDDLLGDTMTDELGDFAVIYHERDFAEVREANPDLYVMVSDSAGTLLYSSRDQVRFEAGRVEYFEIVLNTPSSTAKSAGRASAKKPAAKRTGVRRIPKPKSSARRGSDNAKK